MPSDTRYDLESLAPAKILIADDYALNRDLLAGFFEGTNHSIRFATGGRQAVTLAATFQPDLILMDIRMPDISGIEARDEIVGHSSLAGTLIVAVTASSMLDQERQLRSIFDGFLSKPFSSAQLYTELSKFLPTREEVLVSEDAPAIDEAGFDESKRESWQKAVATLEERKASHWEPISKTMAMGRIREFAGQLAALGEDSGCIPLTRYGTRLLEESESFRLSKVESTMAAFPDLLERIRSELARRSPAAKRDQTPHQTANRSTGT